MELLLLLLGVVAASGGARGDDNDPDRGLLGLTMRWGGASRDNGDGDWDEGELEVVVVMVTLAVADISEINATYASAALVESLPLLLVCEVEGTGVRGGDSEPMEPRDTPLNADPVRLCLILFPLLLMTIPCPTLGMDNDDEDDTNNGDSNGLSLTLRGVELPDNEPVSTPDL